MTVAALFRNESIKTFRRLAFWVTMAFFLFIVSMEARSDWKRAQEDLDVTYALPEAWGSMVGGMGQVALIFGSIILLLLVTNEFGWRTARQNVIDGLSREQFFLGKVMLVPMVGAAFLGAHVAVAGGFALAGTDLSAGEGLVGSVDAAILGAYGLAWIGYGCVVLFVGLAVRSPGPAMAVWFFWVALAEDLAGGVFGRIGPAWRAATEWLPFNTFNRLTNPAQWDPARLAAQVSRAIEQGNDPPTLVASDVLLAVAVGHVTVLLAVTFLWFRRRDL